MFTISSAYILYHLIKNLPRRQLCTFAPQGLQWHLFWCFCSRKRRPSIPNPSQILAPWGFSHIVAPAAILWCRQRHKALQLHFGSWDKWLAAWISVNFTVLCFFPSSLGNIKFHEKSLLNTLIPCRLNECSLEHFGPVLPMPPTAKVMPCSSLLYVQCLGGTNCTPCYSHCVILLVHVLKITKNTSDQRPGGRTSIHLGSACIHPLSARDSAIHLSTNSTAVMW